MMKPYVHFVMEPITVDFDNPPNYRSRPPCPNTIAWRGRQLRINELMRKWGDNACERSHARRHRTNSVRTHYRVQTESGRIFDIYYDPESNRGTWFLSREIVYAETAMV